MLAYGSTIALSAFLLFVVQPIVAKQILPWFGGSAAVWTTCMMFFQIVLLAGYAYSDFVVRRLDASRQRWVHGTLLVASLGCLPILIGSPPGSTTGSSPVPAILWLLGVTIGLPYFALSTTGPLLQAWFTRQFPGARVYRLYALSNVASIVALIAYPPLIEPSASVRVQSFGWSVGYALFVGLGLFVMWRSRRVLEVSAPVAVAPAHRPSSKPSPAVPAPTFAQQLQWLLLSGLGSVLLLAVTAHLTENVASVPFLWLLPLTLYLASFILCFDGEHWYRRGVFFPLAIVCCVALAAGLIASFGPGPRISFAPVPFQQALVLYPLGLFVLCMFLHGELSARRPPPAFITRFYLMVSLGGAAGGVFAAVVAPVLFDSRFELPLALVGAAAVLLFLAAGERARFGAFVSLVASLGCAVLVFAAARYGTVEMERNFYGVLRVIAVDAGSPQRSRLRLAHGDTVHGEQFRDKVLRTSPTTYYGSTSGVGRTLSALRALDGDRSQRVGVIGLGIGTLASYGAPGDDYRFFEIDPAVERLARRNFTYLQGASAAVHVEIGDGRLLLGRAGPLRLRLLVIDAFSGDSIPVHLLTEEAMRIYERHVDPDGAIAFHVSNRYLDLGLIIGHLARGAGWRAIRIEDRPPTENWWLTPSDWIVATSNARLADALIASGGVEELPDPRVAPWTDDYSNLFDVLKVRR